jgi:phosphoribosylaminoimidazolecarboxamide formyltransferase/IMP cyclohydrolase
VHGGILADRRKATHIKTCAENEIGLIDMVIVNLYPFESTITKENVTLDDAIENIDIGGPSMVRSAAKNHHAVTVVVNPERYTEIAQEMDGNEGGISSETRQKLAVEAFVHTANYDAIISQYLSSQYEPTNIQAPIQQLYLKKKTQLRYGENPHQTGAFYSLSENEGLSNLIQHHGKDLSYNNIVDLESAVLIVKELDLPAASIIKHSNPCGVATADTILDAYKKAYDADPVSAFGSIIGLNRTISRDTASEIIKTFVEVVVAPGFDSDALKILKEKASIRLIEIPNFNDIGNGDTYKFVSGGCLIQSSDNYVVTASDLSFPTIKKPNTERINTLLFANTVVKYVKSNAIVIAKDGEIIGVGAGQMSRIEAVELALRKAGGSAKGAVLASDAFFPFSDSAKLAHEAGIVAIIQPGGSKRDQETIDFCNQVGIEMALTGIRHFRH